MSSLVHVRYLFMFSWIFSDVIGMKQFMPCHLYLAVYSIVPHYVRGTIQTSHFSGESGQVCDTASILPPD